MENFMELDPRIKDKPLTVFDMEKAEEFLGEEGYFADNAHDFAKMAYLTPKSILTEIDEERDACPFKSEQGNYYSYFLPAEWVEEAEKEEPELTEEEKLKEEQENKDREDFLKIWFECSEFDERGNLQTGKWSKLEKLDLPFSKERMAYLLAKYIYGLSDDKVTRVEE